MAHCGVFGRAGLARRWHRMAHLGQQQHLFRPSGRCGHGQRRITGQPPQHTGAPVERFHPQRMGAGRWLHDHVIGFSHAHPEFIHRHRLHRPAIGGNDGHRHTRNADVHEAHCAAVDEAQPHALAGLEGQGRPRRGWPAVHQQRIAGDIGDIGRIHAHVAPRRALGHGRLHPELLRVAHQFGQRALVPVVITGIAFQIFLHPGRIFTRVVRQQDHMLHVRLDRVLGLGRNNQRAILPGLFLAPAVGVIPIGAALPDADAIGVGLARRDAGKAVEPRRTIIGTIDQKPMPMDGGGGAQLVGDAHHRFLALLEAQGWAGHTAVDRDHAVGAARHDLHRCPFDHQIISAGLRQCGQQQASNKEKQSQHHAAPCIASIQKAMAIIVTFSSSDTKPRGTLLPPPTQAQVSVRRSM